MRSLHRTTIAALTAVSLFGCTDNSDPTSPDGAGVRPSRYEGETGNALTTVTSHDIALLGIQVRGPEFKQPLRYEIPLTEGESLMPLSLPTGEGYELSVFGYDVYGEQTFGGKAELPYVELGENRPLAVELMPLGNGEGATATFAVLGEERARRFAARDRGR